MWSNELIKEYVEQIWRDAKRSGRSYEDVSHASAAVAFGCNFVKNEEEFRLAILKYANETKKPDNFI